MSALMRTALSGLTRLMILMGLLLFSSAWSLKYWQAWIFLFVFALGSLLVTLDLGERDPGLLQRRMRSGPTAEKEKSQKIIQVMASLGACALLLLPSLDHRFRWSAVANSIATGGDILFAAGFLIIWRVFRANSYTSAIVEVDEKQSVVTTGPYKIVRHPMYAGALLMFFGTPLALASYWGLLVSLFLTAVIIARLLYEERYLASHLSGYAEYAAGVRWRLVPGIW